VPNTSMFADTCGWSICSLPTAFVATAGVTQIEHSGFPALKNDGIAAAISGFISRDVPWKVYLIVMAP